MREKRIFRLNPLKRHFEYRRIDKKKTLSSRLDKNRRYRATFDAVVARDARAHTQMLP